ncbi:DUF960 family protein [Paenibacillus macerans]|uniref:DUF960 family protein n=1 Tax=Paenibacillus macerans TaxID=44252 RepID=UPI00203DB502|nr:DUF960 family protein [Paenibacillus macerans]MCM3700332.1 DUF960 domain-containing protein [Paenibacillus macerans]
MFTGDKYSTPGVRARIPAYLQNMLWYMIETMDVPNKDDLQVFELEGVYEAGKRKQKIVHFQAKPIYSKSYAICTKSIFTCKIFVIDNRTHCTMLLADEY